MPEDQDARPAHSGIAITRVRIRNYRCLRAVTAPLGLTTVLIGENNVGKTSFVDAIHAAIGSGVKSLSEEDIFVDEHETSAPRDRDITTDLLITPTDVDGRTIGQFPDGSPWTELWGNGITQDDRGDDLVIIRTRLAWTAAKREYSVDRHFLREWLATEEEAKDAPKMAAPLGAQHIDPLALFALDAKRDVVDELRSRSSLWGKLTADPGLPAEAIEAIERALSTLLARQPGPTLRAVGLRSTNPQRERRGRQIQLTGCSADALALVEHQSNRAHLELVGELSPGPSSLPRCSHSGHRILLSDSVHEIGGRPLMHHSTRSASWCNATNGRHGTESSPRDGAWRALGC